jgi:aerotolerance regulator-like protein
MLGVLSPAWLLALATLALPIALHLWSPRGGRPIRVGSIRLLLGAQPATRRSWSLRDPVLLAVRCAVLAALALALAGPYWVSRGNTPRWALVADDVARRNALVDSLTQAGLTVVPTDGPATPGDRPQNLWAALAAAARAAPPGARFEVFGPQRLRYFRGPRPTIAARVEWHAREPGTAASNPGPRRTGRLVTIFADRSRVEDARYVRAAIEAAARATGIPASVAVRGDDPGVPLDPVDWIVWLSPRAAPASLVERVRAGATLLTDAGSEAASDRRSRIVLVDRPSDVWLRRRSAATDSGAPLWTDGAGRALLTMAREGRGWRYRFHGRFHPAWSELVLRPAFPEAVAGLWLGADSTGSRPDDRPITLAQLLPGYDPDVTGIAHLPPHGRSLFLPLWLFALATFALERWLVWPSRRRTA